MIKVSENIQLKQVSSADCDAIFQLMKEIYPVAYHNFWADAGNWYINSQYAKEQVLKELSEEKAGYYFILFDAKIVGIFRFIWDEKLANLSEEKQVKLHRFYVHPILQGNGIGKKLIAWLENLAIQKSYTILWLDAMDEQLQAFQFYKKLGYNYHSHTFLSFELMHKKYRKMSQVYKKLI